MFDFRVAVEIAYYPVTQKWTETGQNKRERERVCVCVPKTDMKQNQQRKIGQKWKKRKQGVQTEGGKKTKYTASKQEADRNVEKIEDELEGLQGILCKNRGKFQRS